MRSLVIALFVALATCTWGCSGNDSSAPATDVGRDATSSADVGYDSNAAEDVGSGADTTPDVTRQDTGPTDTASADTGYADTTYPDVGADGGSSCAATHPHVGWTATLSTNYHNVGGTAEIVDDCTIRITNFTFEGAGIDVRIYGAKNGDWANGFAMTGNLVRSTPYDGETLIATVPAGHTLDDLDGISVWCTDVDVDFGSGTFSAP